MFLSHVRSTRTHTRRLLARRVVRMHEQSDQLFDAIFQLPAEDSTLRSADLVVDTSPQHCQERIHRRFSATQLEFTVSFLFVPKTKANAELPLLSDRNILSLRKRNLTIN